MTGAPASGSGRTALVTGAARGIGAAVALRLAADGWRLVLVDACADSDAVDYPLATRQDLDGVVAACSEITEAVAVVADVRHQTALDEAARLAADRFGGLDGAVAVAGILGGGVPLWETDDRLFGAMVGVNLEGVWRLARAAVPVMLERPRPRNGRFVAVASAGALVGLPQLGAYAAAKHGVVGLVRSLAAELGDEGITANAVAPGSTRTDALTASAGFYGLAGPEEFAVHHLEPRLLDPDEIGAAVAFLCSPSASGVNGAVLPVDAGMTSR